MSLSDDFASIPVGKESAPPAVPQPSVAPIAATPAAPVAGPAQNAAPSLSSQFDDTPATAPKAAKAAPAMKVSDYMGAAVEPVLTALTSVPASIAGQATRLGSAILGNNYEGAKQAGENVSKALTYQPQTLGGQQAEAAFGNAAKGAASSVMASPVGPVISGAADAYNKTFVQNQNPLMATINGMVPGVIGNAVAGKLGSSVLDGSLASGTKALVTGETPALPLPDSIPAGTSASGKARMQAAMQAQADATAAKPNYRPNGDGTFTPAPRAVPPTSTPAPAPAAPPSAVSVPAFVPPDLPTPKSVLSPDTQAQNIATLQKIGLDSQRASAIGGDKFTAGQEYQQSKLDSPTGEVLRDQLQKEQGAIKTYAQGLVQGTGATAAAPEAVGQAIRAPLQGLSDYYDSAVGQLYKAADQKAGGLPVVQPTALGDFTSKTYNFDGKVENSQLGKGIDSYLNYQNLKNPDGSLAPMTVQQAEGLRQYFNSQWTPQSSGLIGKVKEALDTDVTKSAGDDVYAAARALHAERKNTLDNPNGISSLLNENGPNGINQAVPDEKVAAKVLSMPTGQMKHIVDTINSLPDSLQPQGQQALSEMKGALAQKIYKAGDSGGTQNGPSNWNAANVTKELNNQRSKLGILFSPDEIANFQTLNDAGHILQAPSAYPGAAVQGHNLLQRGLLYAPPAAGAALGHTIGGIPGMSVGSGIGTGIAAKMAKAAEVANANRLKAAMANPQVIQPKK